MNFSFARVLSILLRIYINYFGSYGFSGFFLGKFFVKICDVGNGTSATGRAFYLLFSPFLALLAIWKIRFCKFISFYKFQEVMRWLCFSNPPIIKKVTIFQKLCEKFRFLTSHTSKNSQFTVHIDAFMVSVFLPQVRIDRFCDFWTIKCELNFTVFAQNAKINIDTIFN